MVATDSPVEYYKEVTVDGVTTSSKYTPDSSVQNPVPVKTSSITEVETSSVKVYANSEIEFAFNANDVAEFMNVIDIIYGDDAYAIISEIGYCTSATRTVSGTSGSTPISYKEAVACQVAAFIPAKIFVADSNEGFSRIIDLGNPEPLPVGSSSALVG